MSTTFLSGKKRNKKIASVISNWPMVSKYDHEEASKRTASYAAECGKGVAAEGLHTPVSAEGQICEYSFPAV